MKVSVNTHQLSQIFHYIKKEYQVLGTTRINGRLAFTEVHSLSQVPLPLPKTIIPFKSLLYPNKSSLKGERQKIAFWGITNCDALALKLFLQEFQETDLLPRDILAVSYACQPDENCFCTAFNKGKIENSDLFVEKEGDRFGIFPTSAKGKEILSLEHLKYTSREIPGEIILKNVSKLNHKKVNQAVSDKAQHEEFWQNISDNCFGCGACSAVCPLCFCTKKNFSNEIDGSCKECHEWDSCFSKSFSEIQNHFDLRPTNKDRLYNWYHHKFVRAYDKSGHFLCTGCGRCITACPAHLNQHKIIESIEKNKG